MSLCIQMTEALPSRRSFLKSAAILPAIAGSLSCFGTEDETRVIHPSGFWDAPREVWLKRPATSLNKEEEIKLVYWADGQLIQDAYLKLSWFMRDLRMEELIKRKQSQGKKIPDGFYPASTISPLLLDILYATNGWLSFHGMPRAIVMNSGFRHPYTNARTEGASRDSRHMRGGAGDIAIPGVNPASVSSYGLWLSAGGVGWYPGKSFTHVDDGKLRFWRG